MKDIFDKVIARKDFEIKIGSQPISVIFVDDKKHFETNTAGEYSSWKNKMRLDPDVKDEYLIKVFLHELMHGFFNVSAITNQEGFKDWEEPLCNILSEQLLLFIQLNKDDTSNTCGDIQNMESSI